MKVIAVVSAKGGVGKTTVGVNLAAALCRQGREVLLLDLDPQNAVSLHLRQDSRGPLGMTDAVMRGSTWREVVVGSASGVRSIPFGHVDETSRHQLEQRLHEDPSLLVRALQQLGLSPDSVVIIDTPPGPSAYLRQALSMANLVLVVALADAGSYATLPAIHELIENYCAQNHHFIDHALVLNQVDRARQLNKDVVQLVRSIFGERIAGLIHEDQAVAEALAHQQSVLDYAPSSQASAEFIECARRIGSLLPGLAVELAS